MKGQRIFITGSASGLGKALAEGYATRGAQLCLSDIDEPRLEETANQIASTGATVAFRRCDVTQERDFYDAADWLSQNWGGVDLVINNAGVAHMGPIETTKIDDWQWAMDINVLSIARSSRAFVPLLRKNKGGAILNIASMAGLLHLPGGAVYNATKAAVVAASETMYIELENDNIRVHVACPAFFKTDLAKNMRASDTSSELMTKRLVERARLDSDEIAGNIIKGVEKGERIIFTHPKSRQMWMMKRLLPSGVYFRQLRQQLRKIEARMARGEKQVS